MKSLPRAFSTVFATLAMDHIAPQPLDENYNTFSKPLNMSRRTNKGAPTFIVPALLLLLAFSFERASAQSASELYPDLVDNVARDFYKALSYADGDAAIQYLIPEKRNVGSFRSSEISKFYSQLSPKLDVIGIQNISENLARVSYSYGISGGKTCKNTSTVTTKVIGSIRLIESIKSDKDVCEKAGGGKMTVESNFSDKPNIKCLARNGVVVSIDSAGCVAIGGEIVLAANEPSKSSTLLSTPAPLAASPEPSVNSATGQGVRDGNRFVPYAGGAYLDRTSISRNGSIVSFDTVYDTKGENVEDYVDEEKLNRKVFYKSTSDTEEIDCETGYNRTIQYRFYSGSWAGGKIVATRNLPDPKWVDLIRDSDWYRIMGLVCK